MENDICHLSYSIEEELHDNIENDNNLKNSENNPVLISSDYSKNNSKYIIEGKNENDNNFSIKKNELEENHIRKLEDKAYETIYSNIYNLYNRSIILKNNYEKYNMIKSNFSDDKINKILFLTYSPNSIMNNRTHKLKKFYSVHNEMSPNKRKELNIGKKRPIYPNVAKKMKIKDFNLNDSVYNLIDLLNGKKLKHFTTSKNSFSISKIKFDDIDKINNKNKLSLIIKDYNNKSNKKSLSKANIFSFSNKRKKLFFQETLKKKKIFSFSNTNSPINNINNLYSGNGFRKNRIGNNKKPNKELKIEINRNYISKDYSRNIDFPKIKIDKTEDMNLNKKKKFKMMNLTKNYKKNEIFDKKINQDKMLLKLNKLKKSKRIYNYYNHFGNNEAYNLYKRFEEKKRFKNNQLLDIYLLNDKSNSKTNLNSRNISNSSTKKNNSIQKNYITSYSNQNIRNPMNENLSKISKFQSYLTNERLIKENE